MYKSDISKSVIMGVGWTDIDIAREANRYIIELIKTYPDKLIGFCSINPIWGDQAINEIEECHSMGLKGIGELHPDTQNFDITKFHVLEPVMDCARRLDIPIVIHTSEPVGHEYNGKGNTTPEKVYKFICNFPENIIICAHIGGGLPFYGLMPEVKDVLKNVYFDTAALPYLYDNSVITIVAKTMGAEHILFGSDYPLLSQPRVMSNIKSSGLELIELNEVLGGNMSTLLGLT
jgi:predicted TIM-barrel fold metal-dependent hydrolase